MYALEHGYDVHGPGRRRRPARPGRASPSCSRRMRRGPDARHGLRLALPRPTTTATVAPISRRTGIHIFAFLLSRIVGQRGHRPDVGLPPVQPPRDRALRPRLPARLPRGRGGADAPPPPAARCARCRCGCAQRGGGRLVDRLRQVGLLHDQGAARAVRRPAARRGRSSSPASRARSPRSTGSDGRPHPDRRDHRRRGAARWSCSSSCAGGGCWSATRCCGCSPPSCCSAWRSGAALLTTVAERGRHRLRAERAVLRRVRLRPRAAAALLARDLAPGRPEQGARPAHRRCCSSSSRSSSSSARRRRGGNVDERWAPASRRGCSLS